MRLASLALPLVVAVASTACPGNKHPMLVPRRADVSVGKNIRVSRDDVAGAYTRKQGTADPVLRACSTSRFPQNEPAVAIDPRRPSVIVAGAIENCPGAAGRSNWVGFYRSTDDGSSWFAGLVPGYPGDESRAARKSPASRCVAASDPTLAFDLEGRLFFGFLCIERKTLGSSILVASYEGDGARYRSTVVLARSRVRETLSRVEQDKINIAVDQTSGPGSGTVYAAWTQFAYQPRDRTVLVARSTDHGSTFSQPVVATRGQPGLSPDLAVGPAGTLYLTFRTIPELQQTGGREIGLTFSPNGGRTFTAVTTVAPIRPFDSKDFSGEDRRTCGHRPLGCRSGFTFPRFFSNSAVAADAFGVHVVWAARRPGGQSKIFVRSSPDGSRWTSPPLVLDPARRGHQFFPDVASAGGIITAVFYDTRADRGYSPHRPPGNDKEGRSTGDFLDVYAAFSADGGRSWTRRRVTSKRSNMNYEVFGPAPFFGDYIYVSAVPGRAFAVWTDTRDLRPGRRAGSDGFDVAASSCSRTDMACLTMGGLDQNIYGAVIRQVAVR